MTISSIVSRIDYVGNGSVSTYSFPFRILADSHVRVTVRDTDEAETTLTLNTHYTVTGSGGASGSISLVAGSFDWLNGSNFLKTDYVLTLRRIVPLLQETDIRNQGDFYPESHEDAFDYLMMATQQLKDEVYRAIKTPETEYETELVIPVVADRASKFLAFDSDGDPIASIGASSAPVSEYMATVLEEETAAAARTTLGFSGASGTVATANIEASAVTTAKIADLNVTTGKLADNAVTTAKIADLNVTTAKIADLNVTTAKIAGGAVTPDQIASNAVTTAKIADGNVTQAKRAAMTVSTTATAGNMARTTLLNFTTTSTSYVDVTDSTITLTTTGRPVRLVITGGAPSGGSPEYYTQNNGAGSTYIDFYRDATRLQVNRVNTSNCAAIECLDTPAAGTYTYKLQMSVSANTGFIINAYFQAYEV